MGITLGKNSNQSEATSKFRRAVATVQVLNKTEKDSKQKKNSRNEHTNGNVPHLQIDRTDDKEDSRSIRSFLTTVDDDDDTKSVRSFNFVYRDTSDAWAALRAGQVPEVGATDKEFSVVDSGFSGYKAVETRVSQETEKALSNGYDKKKEEEPFDVPYEPPGGWDADQDMDPVRCTTCNKRGGVLHPCRVCDNAFHESCLQRIGRLHDQEARAFFKKARTNTGWSCHDCESLGSMLHQDDMVELIEVFDKADVDDDATIDLEEFVKYRQWVVREREGRNLTPDEVDDETIQFRAMDTDMTGNLSWWEFLDHEALRRLAAKTKKQLVKLLSTKEIQKARDNFRAFDTDLDGSITEYEARRAYKRWYSHFVPNPEDMTPSERRRLSLATDTQQVRQLSTHIQANTNLLMGADRDNSGTISWEEYLCEQALYIIAARPNVGPVHMKNRRPSFAR
ncbi:PHD finger protein 24-like [Amphiura filiformis]|uniref:PHD finger protein 24-like n=1 Tax=Amphiura filiformis TaxID=82378 RepID=UPI003B21BE02